MARQLIEQDRDPRLRWHDDPAAFARECIDWPEGTALTTYQSTILAALANDRRVAVRSLHGAGKTTAAALAVLWFAITRDAAGIDWKCITTAGAWRQLERYLWPEIHLWAKRVRWDLVGRPPFDSRTELLALTLKLFHGQAFAAASDDPALLEGAHATSLLLVLDESKSIPTGVWDAVEGAMSGVGEAFALATSTPGEPSGRFYEIHNRKAGLTDWQTFHITLEDAVTAGRVSPSWATQRALQWGESSAVYLNRVLGEFASSDEDGVIPLAWVEAAIERWHTWESAGKPSVGQRPVIGVDVARSGSDKTVIASRCGDVVEYLESHRLADTMETTGHVAVKLSEPSAIAVVDVIGIGAGVVDRLREQKLSVVAFNASEHSDRRDRTGELGFLNRRSQAWWHLRELLDPAYGATLALPDDDELIGDLCAPKWRIGSTGKVQIEAKDEIRKRLGRSPDAGDAVVMACTLSLSSYGSDPAFQKAVPWTASGPAVPYGAVPWASSLNTRPDPFHGAEFER
jgi:hypothetical protein